MRFASDFLYFFRKGYTLRNAWNSAKVRKVSRNA